MLCCDLAGWHIKKWLDAKLQSKESPDHAGTVVKKWLDLLSGQHRSIEQAHFQRTQQNDGYMFNLRSELDGAWRALTKEKMRMEENYTEHEYWYSGAEGQAVVAVCTTCKSALSLNTRSVMQGKVEGCENVAWDIV